MNDTIKVLDPVTNQKMKKQRRLVCSTLREAFNIFKKDYPDVKIGFSTFAALRPKECLLPGPAGTHQVCVCTIHQNIKLMIEGVGLPNLTENSTAPLLDHNDCMREIVCGIEGLTRPNCRLGYCVLCPSIDKFKQRLRTIFTEAGIEELTYSQWVSTDRSDIEQVTQTLDDFVSKFCDRLLLLRKHGFIAKEQNKAFTRAKEDLEIGEVLVVGDFSENFKFIVQDASQSYHWNNGSVTLHPFCCYYKNQDNQLQELSYVPISECLKHDTVAVYLFQEKLVDFLKKNVPTGVTKIIYFSDGCAAQYKNCKNFLNLCLHKNDFGVDVEWHFFATSHGKNSCDVVGGTLKRIVRRVSLTRMFTGHITNAWMFYKTLKEHHSKFPSGLTVEYFHESDHIAANDFLQKDRLGDAVTIPNTRKYHFFKPTSTNSLLVKEYSNSDVTSEVYVTNSDRVTVVPNPIVAKIKFGVYVTAMYNDQWYLGRIESHEPNDEDMVTINFLTPAGNDVRVNFKFPSDEDKLLVHVDDILTVPEVKEKTGRYSHCIDLKDSREASRKLLAHDV